MGMLSILTAFGMETHTLEVGSHIVQVERLRPLGSSRSDATVVFLHGWGMSPRGYLTGLQAMAAKGVQVDAISLPGYGQSTPLSVRESGLDGHAVHLAAAIERAAYRRPVHLVGHSFGGGIALRIAAMCPDLVGRVTVACPAGGAGGGAAAWGDVVRSFLFDGGSAGLLAFARSFTPVVRRTPLKAVISGFAARRADLVTDLHAAIARGLDVHLILADGDVIVPPGRLADPRSGARISVVSGRHSWPHVEPRRWADLTVDVSESLPSQHPSDAAVAAVAGVAGVATPERIAA